MSTNIGETITVLSMYNITFLWVVDVLRIVEPLEALDGNGKAERHEEDRVHEGAEHLGTRPPECVLKWQDMQEMRMLHLLLVQEMDHFHS